jgi:hypothetical protein
MWLVLGVLAMAIVKHKPVIGIVVLILLAISGLITYFTRRKQRRSA